MKFKQGSAPRLAWWLLLVVGFAIIALLSPGGHMSTDTVVSLLEGRTGERMVWGPPMFSSILGVFDKMSPGAPLYIVSMMALLGVSWAAMATLRPRTSWLAVVLLAGAFALPQLVLYQAIVWKDVAFANFSVAAFVVLGIALRDWSRPAIRWPMLALACLFLALGALVRQNGALTIVFFALALGWTTWGRGWKTSLLWAVGGFIAPLALTMALDAVTPVKDPPGRNLDAGPRIVQGYDVVGAIARDPKRPLPAIEAVAPQAAETLRREAAAVYSPERVDFLQRSEALGVAMGGLSDETVSAEWFDLLKSDPLGYAGQRFEVFRWVFLSPIIDRCLPGHVGVEGPDQFMKPLHMQNLRDPGDTRLWNYVTYWLDTPAYEHLTFAILAAVVALFLMVRRQGADIAMAGLMLSGLAFAASFFVISLACDYRYIYFLDLAAITGVLYVALDPGLGRPRKR